MAAWRSDAYIITSGNLKRGSLAIGIERLCVFASATNLERLNDAKEVLQRIFYGLLMTGKVALIVENEFPISIYGDDSKFLDTIDYLKGLGSLEVYSRRRLTPKLYERVSAALSLEEVDSNHRAEVEADLRSDPDGIVVANELNPFCEDIPAYSVVSTDEYERNIRLRELAMNTLLDNRRFERRVLKFANQFQMDRIDLASSALGDVLAASKIGAKIQCNQYSYDLYRLLVSPNELATVKPLTKVLSLESIFIPQVPTRQDFEQLSKSRHIDSFRQFIANATIASDHLASGRTLIDAYYKIVEDQKNLRRKLVKSALSVMISMPISALEIIFPYLSVPLDPVKHEMIDRLFDRNIEKKYSWLFFLHGLRRNYGRPKLDTTSRC
jgi:hypothetical protein